MPFSRAEFFWIFARYNDAVWPAPIVLCALALVAAFFAFRRSSAGSRTANGILAVMWLWMAAAYHAAFFASINPLAIVFAILFAIQGLMFGWLAIRGGAIYQPKEDSAGLAGALLVIFSLAVYPALSIAAGHRYPAQPTFGVPCPTTVFTMGMLVWAGELAPKRVLVIPVLWAAVAGSAAIQLGVVEDLSLPVAAIVMVVLRNAVVRRRRLWSTRKGFLRAA